MNLLERDSAAVWHPYSALLESMPLLDVVRASGAWVYTRDGRRYLDAISSWWTNVHGHCHPYLTERIAAQSAQLDHVLFAGCTHEQAVRAAERLLNIASGAFQRVFFSDNGSTAVEAALKMALQTWCNRGAPRTTIVAFAESYHGDTFGAMSVSGRGLFTAPFGPLLFDVVHIPAPVPGCESHSLIALEDALEKNDVAAFIYEPLVLGAGGMLMYQATALEPLLAACRTRRVLTIADEVMTGFGRTSAMFAGEHIRHAPDLMCLSKGITGGMLPCGVTLCGASIVEAFHSADRTRAFFHGHSYTANPIVCAAVNANLDLFEREEPRAGWTRIAARFADVARSLRMCPRVQGVRQCGTILAYEVSVRQASGYLNPVRDHLISFAREHEVLLRPLGTTVYAMPPYCVSEEELDRLGHVLLAIPEIVAEAA